MILLKFFLSSKAKLILCSPILKFEILEFRLIVLNFRLLGSTWVGFGFGIAFSQQIPFLIFYVFFEIREVQEIPLFVIQMVTKCFWNVRYSDPHWEKNSCFSCFYIWWFFYLKPWNWPQSFFLGRDVKVLQKLGGWKIVYETGIKIYYFFNRIHRIQISSTGFCYTYLYTVRIWITDK